MLNLYDRRLAIPIFLVFRLYDLVTTYILLKGQNSVLEGNLFARHLIDSYGLEGFMIINWGVSVLIAGVLYVLWNKNHVVPAIGIGFLIMNLLINLVNTFCLMI
jgi:hypothetical protein